jgi:hypothetical protein
MRDLLLLLLLGVTAYLGYDNYSKRNALKAAQEEVQRLNSDRSQGDQSTVRQRPIYARPYAPAAASPPAWFQERLNERPSLDEPVRHRHNEEETSKSTSYGASATPH